MVNSTVVVMVISMNISTVVSVSVITITIYLDLHEIFKIVKCNW